MASPAALAVEAALRRTMTVSMPPPSLRAAAWVGLLALAACDRQSDADYRGEPLARIQGTITSNPEAPPTELAPVISWEGQTVAVVETEVVSEFPARFRIDLFEPPPENSLNDLSQGGALPDQARVAVGLIVAWPVELDGENVDPDGLAAFGVAEHHVLVYADRDVLAGTAGADLLGGELDAGYHVVEVVPREEPDCGEVFDCLRPAPDDLDTRIPIRVDRATELDFPEWDLW